MVLSCCHHALSDIALSPAQANILEVYVIRTSGGSQQGPERDGERAPPAAWLELAFESRSALDWLLVVVLNKSLDCRDHDDFADIPAMERAFSWVASVATSYFRSLKGRLCRNNGSSALSKCIFCNGLPQL